VQALIATILQALVAAFLDWGKAWVASNQAEADAWARKTLEGQLAAQKRADDERRRIAASIAGTDTPSPTQWNHPTIGALVLVGLCWLVSGCVLDRMAYVEGAWPLIDAPPRPQVPTEPATWTPRERILADYAAKLESAVAAYDAAARRHNGGAP
jgi:hypothetical protein